MKIKYPLVPKIYFVIRAKTGTSLATCSIQKILPANNVKRYENGQWIPLVAENYTVNIDRAVGLLGEADITIKHNGKEVFSTSVVKEKDPYKNIEINEGMSKYCKKYSDENYDIYCGVFECENYEGKNPSEIRAVYKRNSERITALTGLNFTRTISAPIIEEAEPQQ